MAARGFLGAGDLYIARYNTSTSVWEEFAGPYEASKFEIKPNSDIKEMSSRGRTTYGQVIESVPLPQPADFSVTLAEVDKESLAMALFGSASSTSQGSGSVADESITLTAAKMDKWLPLSKQNLASTGFVVTGDGGTPTYVLGTDYEVNHRLGWIKVLSTGAIASTATIKVDFTYNAISATKIAGSTQSQVRAKFMLDGVNFADQLPVIVSVYEGILTPNSAFDFLANDFAAIELTGRLKTPAGKSEPFTVEMRDAA